MQGFDYFISNKHYNVQLTLVSDLLQSEESCNETVSKLCKKIIDDGTWKTVIPAEWSSGWVMDGNHRLNVAKKLGLKYLPIVRLHYDDPRVNVLCWDNGKKYSMNQLQIDINSGILLPYKTTKHIFTPQLPKVSIPLNALI